MPESPEAAGKPAPRAQGNDTDPSMKHIGNLIREELAHQERSISWFARKLCYDRSNVYRLLGKESLDTRLLHRISVLLGRDFFAELSDEISKQEHPVSHDRQ